MSRKYSSWASNKPSINPNLSFMKLTTVGGNEQDQLKNLERVEAIPHMYINVDAPPPPSSSSMTPTVITNAQTKIWPVEKSSKNSSFESTSSTSKRTHKHKHHHHHHNDKRHHHHHHHHNRRHRAKSAESIRNRPNQTLISPSKIMVTNPQYIEQDQQQQQQQPMVVYREVPSNEGYTIDNNRLATVPYDTQNETALIDDQQAPYIVYRDANFQQQPQSIVTDGYSQQFFCNHDQEANIKQQNIPLQSIENNMISHRVPSVNESQVVNHFPCICNQSRLLMNCKPSVNTGCMQEIEQIYTGDVCCYPSSTVNCVSDSCFMQQNEPSICFSPPLQQQQQQQQQQQPSQIVYCTDSNQQEYICASNNNNFIQQSISPQQQQQQQQQFVCLDNLSTIQPTIINQIPVFNSLPTNSTSQSLITLPQSQVQRTANFVIQQSQPQSQPQPFQIIQQPQPLQVIQQPQSLQVIQQPQPLQFIQSSQPQSGQILQFASATPQFIQSPPVLQTIQAQPVLQTIQIPTQAVAASPQLLYQRPYDPVVVPIQNQPMAIANPPVVALSQPSYAPSRIIPAIQGTQSQPPNMFRQALIRTVAGRTGLPIPASGGGGGGLQLMQSTAGAPIASNPNLLLADCVEQSASLPIVPLTPGGLLIPYQPSEASGLRPPGLLPRAGGYPSNLQNFNDIQEQIEQQRTQLTKSLQQEYLSRIPSPPVISTASRNQTTPYTSGNRFSSDVRPSGTSFPPIPSTSYVRPSSTAPNYSSPSYIGSTSGSILSGPSTGPYRPLGL
ncbi:unnamed protein product [Rotaria sp. Silwood2]|nr:unnamed protein product [Rotaria sp. Silwood2]CAF3983442.1 unnamed protein product [Rotaria sp. Silwood2]